MADPQTPTATPTPNPALEQAKLEADLAEQRKKKAVAEKDELEAGIAASKARLGIGQTGAKTTAPTGTVSGSTGDMIETTLLATLAARAASVELAKRLCQAQPQVKTLVINNGLDHTALLNYRALIAQTDAVIANYDKLLATTREHIADGRVDIESVSLAIPLLGIAAATEAVRAVADLTSLFRSDVELKNQTLAITEEAVVTSLVHALRTRAELAGCKEMAVYYPAEYPMNFAPASTSKLMEKLTLLIERRRTGDALVLEAKAVIAELVKKEEEVKKKIKELQAITPQTPAIGDQIKQQEKQLGIFDRKRQQLERDVQALDIYKTATDDLLKLLTSGDVTKLTPAAALLRVEWLAAVLEKGDAYALDVTVSAGGTTRIAKNIFWNPSVKHTGGATISARLYNNGGQLKHSFVEDFYIDYVSGKKVREAMKYESLENLRGKLNP